MAVEILPLGAPELGMTRAEILDYAATMWELSSSTNETFYTLLFAYMAALYMVSSQLTRRQYFIVNIAYLVVMADTLFTSFVAQDTAREWGKYSGLTDPTAGIMAYWAEFSIVSWIVLIFLSIWFGRKIRHPASE